jgi:uncharacterized protein
MSRPVDRLAALTIGTVDSVSPSEIHVLLDPNAPQAIALNTGVPMGFPRINGYLLVPNETGAVVGLIVWVGVERSQFPRRPGLKDFGLVDLPFPLRRLTLTPLGTLIAATDLARDGTTFQLQRGVSAFPSVGDSVQLPTADQLKGIIQASKPEDQRVRIGTSPLAADAVVTVDPDKVFGRHLAVLGNTGSGKSCSVAGLIRWSLAAARSSPPGRKHANARFIVLDPNGEYSAAFSDYPDVRRFQVAPKKNDKTQPLLLPAWMWDSHEWAAFALAAPGVQRPLLLQALRDMRSGARLAEPAERQALRLMRSYKTFLEARIAQGASGYQGFPENKNCGNQLVNLQTDAEHHSNRVKGALREALGNVAAIARDVSKRRYWKSANKEGFNDFSEAEVRQVVSAIAEALAHLPDQGDEKAVSEDAPTEFSISALPDQLDLVGAEAPGGQTAQFLASLTMRIRMMLADRRLGPVVNPAPGSITFRQWLGGYVGEDQASNGELAIVDLSLVPSEVVHIVIAVVARLVFEASQRYKKLYDSELPTVLVLEEAHEFIKRGTDEETSAPSPAQMCRLTFERIAREGRKFGLGLVLSSQRPSELSPTVLAQCNTFLLHRIVNDRDQELVGKLVPDNLAGLLKELPSLPSRQAVLLGWAATVPTLVEILELPEAQQPRSQDPQFWAVWTGEEQRSIDWDKIVDDWTGIATEGTDGGPDQGEGK